MQRKQNEVRALTKETEQVEQTKPRNEPEIDFPHELLVLQNFSLHVPDRTSMWQDVR